METSCWQGGGPTSIGDPITATKADFWNPIFHHLWILMWQKLWLWGAAIAQWIRLRLPSCRPSTPYML